MGTKLKQIYPKGNGTGNFRFKKRNTEVSATPLGSPMILRKQLVQSYLERDLKSIAPDKADAYMLGEAQYMDEPTDVRVPVQFYKIRTIHQ